MTAAARVLAAGIGAVELGAGTALLVSGIVAAGAGVLLAPTTGGASLGAVPLGILNATLGAAAILDSANMLHSASSGSPLQPSTFAQIGAQYGGNLGGQVGDGAAIAGQVYSASKVPQNPRAAAYLVGSWALTAVLPESTAECN